MSDTPEFVTQLRQRLKDQRAGRTAFRFSCTDTNATDCLLTVTLAKHFVTQPINARDARALDIDLLDPTYGTMRKLVEYLQARPGYSVEIDRDYMADHPAADLELSGSASILGHAVALRHHLFTDSELEALLALACSRHNLSYTPATVPDQERVFVLQLAHALALRDLATDSAKRKELEYTVDQLLDIARDEEDAYNRDYRRQSAMLPRAAPIDAQNPGRGDVVVSHSYRRSLRTGYQSPISAALPPTPTILVQPGDSEIEDIKVTLQWSRNRDLGFYAMELWRDTRPNIQRPELVTNVTDPTTLQREMIKRPFTPRLCFRSAGPHNKSMRTGGLVRLTEEGGQAVITFTDAGYSLDDASQWVGPATAPPLEPNTVYYYRLFVISLNDERTSSNEVVVTTKAMRALINSGGLTPITGPAGTACTLTGTGFDVNTRVTLGDKTVGSLVLVSSTQMTFTVPTFANAAAKGLQHSIVATSGNGLIDVLSNGFKLT